MGPQNQVDFTYEEFLSTLSNIDPSSFVP